MIPFVLAVTLAAPSNDQALYERLAAQTAQAWNAERGAWVEKDGLPSTSSVELALLRSGEPGGDQWRQRAERTIDFTWTLFDSVGGGFVQLPKHADPTNPGFDKRTDSNAARLENLVDLMQAGGGETAEKHAAQVIDYFERVLLDGRGGFMPGQIGDRFLIPDVNGLAIHAWMRWCAATGDARRRDFGLLSLDRLWSKTWDDRFGLMRKGDFDVVLGPPQLTDQVEAGRAYLLSSQVTGRQIDRDRAVLLGNLIVDRFVDRRKGGFLTRSVPDKDGGVKKAPVESSENARAARFLCELSAATGDPRYRAAARTAWAAFEEKFEKEGLRASEWAIAVHESFAPANYARADWQTPETAKPKPRSRRFRGAR